MAKHAACDCHSYSEHASMTEFGHCTGPLATVLTECYGVDELAARQLQDRFPWLTMHQIAALIAWQPGQPLPSTHG